MTEDPLAGHAAGTTPIDSDESEGLRLPWVATRADLDEAEQASILRGLRRRRWRDPSVEDLLDDKAVRDLHRDLFGAVWSWAGRYRSTEKSIGVDPRRIAVEVRTLVDDAAVWRLGMPVDELGVRFHHRLVQIHPFPNGNGRHSRAMTDLLVRALGAEPFTWGRSLQVPTEELRVRYIAALRAADRGDLSPLSEFVRF